MLRGDAFRLVAGKGVGHEPHGDRFGIVVQGDALLPRSVVLVAPTSRSARPASFRPEVDVAGGGAVDVSRLGDLAGHLTPEETWGVDEAGAARAAPAARAVGAARCGGATRGASSGARRAWR